MWLLNAETRRLEEFFEDQAPPYAILSHTWGAEEVNFEDMEGTSPPTHKLGYQKIVWTCEQALSRGLYYAWVDTCCIDKTSSAELSESINSMYRWYHKADICFAYLSDVPLLPDEGNQASALAQSRWFERGWTLQELLAPKKLAFFTAKWAEIGDRATFSRAIEDRTRIDAKFLDGHAERYLSRTSIGEKMSWASQRKTTRVEDTAYCLLGILGVNMPLLYGEGAGAFIRLQEELIRHSDDQTIFVSDWRSGAKQVLDTDPYQGVLARSPAAFSRCNSLESRGDSSHRARFALTNQGVAISVPCCWQPGRGLFAMLLCGPRSDPTSMMALPLRAIHGTGDLYDKRGPPIVVEYNKCRSWRRKSITLLVHANVSEEHTKLAGEPVWIRSIPTGFAFRRYHPPRQWSLWGPTLHLPVASSSSSEAPDTLPFFSIGEEDGEEKIKVIITASEPLKWLCPAGFNSLRVKCLLIPDADSDTRVSKPRSYLQTASGVFFYANTGRRTAFDKRTFIVEINSTTSRMTKGWALLCDACADCFTEPLSQLGSLIHYVSLCVGKYRTLNVAVGSWLIANVMSVHLKDQSLASNSDWASRALFSMNSFIRRWNYMVVDLLQTEKTQTALLVYACSIWCTHTILRLCELSWPREIILLFLSDVLFTMVGQPWTVMTWGVFYGVPFCQVLTMCCIGIWFSWQLEF